MDRNDEHLTPDEQARRRDAGTDTRGGDPLDEALEGGRVAEVERSPEEDLMNVGSSPTPGGAERSRFDEIDERAADDARMRVRRQEHSADD